MQDLHDAADYLGLKAHKNYTYWHNYVDSLMTSHDFQRQPRHSDAAAVGYGLGLCKSITCREKCEAEYKNMTGHTYLSVFWSNTSLNIECGRSSYVYITLPYWQQHTSNYHEDLGLDEYRKIWQPDWQNLFWDKMKWAIGKGGLERCEMVRNVTDIMFLGEGGDNPRLKQAALDAIMSWKGQLSAPKLWVPDAQQKIYLGSEAAAEMALRISAPNDDC